MIQFIALWSLAELQYGSRTQSFLYLGRFNFQVGAKNQLFKGGET